MKETPSFRAKRQADDSLEGRVVHIDAFGNLVTDVRCADLPPQPIVEIAGERTESISATYGEGRGLLAITGSSGYLEISVAGGSAARQLSADVGVPVLVRVGGR